MGWKVQKTFNIDPEKLRQAREYLRVDTDTEVIDRLLEDCVFERDLAALQREFAPVLKRWRSRLRRQRPRPWGGGRGPLGGSEPSWRRARAPNLCWRPS